jgi:cytochrome c-type biogenesis protein CcmF
MNTGELLIQAAFALAIASTALFTGALRGRKLPGAPLMFGLHTAALVAAITLLIAHFAAHRFQFEYVAQHSSRALTPIMSIAASWAGQEGSILLWAAIVAVLGLALMRQPGRLSEPAMFFVSASQLFLVGILLIRSPFRLGATVPADGFGLNPLLEDPWMVAHPPALFVGYAALVIPFALAAAALVRNDYRDWNRATWPWALFGTLSLGVGIALGGVWAYKVLGWGGFWGWDPVENASLIPWLTTVALIHGLLIQRTTGSLARTNLSLALLGWALVVGGTYMTRSGVLQDFSVHSFADSGLNAPLIAFLAGSAGLGAVLMGWRWKSIPGSATSVEPLSREGALWLGLLTVLILAALVTLGTTSPLLTTLAGQPASVQTAFYNMVALPLGIALALLMAVAPALRWSRQSGLTWLTALVPGLVVGVLAGVAAFLSGMREISWISIMATTGFALGVNTQVAFRLFRRGWAYGAGYLGHVGIAVMILGIVISATLGKSEKVSLVQGETAQVLGYALTFEGTERGPRGEQIMRVNVEAGTWRHAARPMLLESPQTNGVVRTPDISGTRDLYISPVDLRPAQAEPDALTWFAEGQEVRIGDVAYAFQGFRFEGQDRMRVTADVTVRVDGHTHSYAPAIEVGPEGQTPLDAEIEGVGRIGLRRVDADNARVGLALPSAGAGAATSLATIEVSTKPWINLVWVGALLALIGTAIAGLRRAAETIPAPARSRPGRTPATARATVHAAPRH